MDHLADFVAFCDATDDTCITRCAPLPWWKCFIGDAERASLRLPRAVPKPFEAATVKRKRLSREAAIQAEVFGEAFIVAEVREAKKHFTAEDGKKVRVLRSAVQKVGVDLGEDVARASCWPDQTAEEVMRSWSLESVEKVRLRAVEEKMRHWLPVSVGDRL
jgi:hypothetical protein